MKGYSEMSKGDTNIGKPKDCFTQTHDQAPLNYIERNNKTQKSEAAKIRRTAYKGRYTK